MKFSILTAFIFVVVTHGVQAEEVKRLKPTVSTQGFLLGLGGLGALGTAITSVTVLGALSAATQSGSSNSTPSTTAGQ